MINSKGEIHSHIYFSLDEYIFKVCCHLHNFTFSTEYDGESTSCQRPARSFDLLVLNISIKWTKRVA